MSSSAASLAALLLLVVSGSIAASQGSSSETRLSQLGAGAPAGSSDGGTTSDQGGALTLHGEPAGSQGGLGARLSLLGDARIKLHLTPPPCPPNCGHTTDLLPASPCRPPHGA